MYRRHLLVKGVVLTGATIAGCVGDDNDEPVDDDTDADIDDEPVDDDVDDEPIDDDPDDEIDEDVDEEPEWSEAEEAYLISTLGELNWIRNDREADYLLVDDIDASATVNWNDGDGWEPIGTVDLGEEIFEFFEGSLDGQGFVIEDLFIDRGDTGFIGLFGIIGPDAMVANVGLENVDIIGGENYTGGLTGANNGTVSNSYATGSVSGYYWVGGLVAGNGGGDHHQLLLRCRGERYQ